MSLLMKALEKAAKDRGDGTAETPPPATPVTPASAVGKAAPELTLEPVSNRATEPPAAARAPVGGVREKTAPAATARDPAQAAAIIRAASPAETSRSNPLAYLRDRPLMTFGTLAVLFLIGFGGYVYVEIMNPGLLAAKPRPAPAAAIAKGAAPLPGAANSIPAAPSTAAAAEIATPVALTSLTPPSEQPAVKEKPAAPAPVVAAATPVAAPLPPAVTPHVAAPTPRDSIKVTAATPAPSVSPVLTDAYDALTAGKLEPAQRLYEQLLKTDPRNIDALLGLAAIATQQGDREASSRYYIKVIELDPRNSLAQAGLLSVLGSADPQAAETRVKQLIGRDPGSAFLYFTLGNTYIDQARWPDAQQAFFQAHHLQPDNPDYAYNLAVALEHIGQSKAALEYYRRAVLLAAAKGRSNFSPAAAQARVSKLEKVVQ
jgi:tetratricopeptide (TPR) repeat protein